MMKDVHYSSISSQRGAVSLFVVIFTALLITTITISFTQLMMRDQQQATYSDLSESAYDSAVAGVEDAKRALLAHRQCGDSDSVRCNSIRDAISSGTCDTLSKITAGTEDSETLIMQEEGDRSLAQAYTCVKVSLDTADYLGSFDSASAMTLIPLRGVNNFDRVKISWHQSASGGDVDLLSSVDGDIKLPPVGDESWPEDRPSLLRAQLINRAGSDGFRLSDFDNTGYSNTLFLAPSRDGISEHSFATDARRAGEAEPLRSSCQAAILSGGYACEVELVLGGTVESSRDTVFLALAAFYRPTDYKIELMRSGTLVAFRGVQPEVDSTGRANDLFRRVVSRVEAGNTFNYPVAALETSGSLCKNFHITNDTGDYQNFCNP